MGKDELFCAYMGQSGKKILQSEIWSCPDAETYLTGIDYYKNPQKCRLEMKRLYPRLNLPVPETDESIPLPVLDKASVDKEAYTVRWGAGMTDTFRHGEAFFNDPEEVFRFSPLEHADFTEWNHVVVNYDFSDEETLYNQFRRDYPAEWGDKAPANSSVGVTFYNTMFMWPMLTFGWELFLECCLDERFKRIMDEFAEINRRVFRAFARLPINFVTCHDDIAVSRGPVCSPKWMNEYIFPRYEEYWSILKAAGKEIIFMGDGCLDVYADDIFACGARGIVTEPYTDFKAIAGKHKDCYLAGEGDVRILNRNNRDEIKQMVKSMVETADMSAGYVMSVGNHIPWNTEPEGIKTYLELTDQLGYRQ